MRRQRGKGNPMNPNLTIGYMAAHEKRHEVERNAARGWIVEEAAARASERRVDFAGTLKGCAATIFEGPRRLFRGAAGIGVPAAAAPL
jgi:hypothetical protein